MKATRYFFDAILIPALLLSCFAVVGTGVLALSGKFSANGDEIAYWAAGRQLLYRANPYDTREVLGIQRAAGMPVRRHQTMMRNPPQSLLLALPFGVPGQKTSSIAWAVLQIAGLCTSVCLAWRLDEKRNPGAYLLGYAFGPALACVLSGQIGVVMLLGLTLFLVLHNSRPFTAGAALWLCALKPHLFVPFAAVLLLWIIQRRMYRLMAGLAATLIGSAAIITVLDPHVWGQYSAMMSAQGIYREPIPTISYALRDAVWPHAGWMLYLPCILAAGWAVEYFRRNRLEWDWMRHGGLVIVVSLLVAPYSWFSDQAVLLPPLLYVAARTSRPMVTIFAACSAAVQLAILKGASFHSPVYLLSMPIWLLWFLAAGKFEERRVGDAADVAVAA